MVMANLYQNENVFSQFNFMNKSAGKKGALKTIIDNSYGCVKPGEMLLVLGRPGAGCTSLLNILTNKREGYAEITGDVNFGSMSHKEALQFRGQIVMNTEEELFYPTLTVGETIEFAAGLKVPAVRPETFGNAKAYQAQIVDFLLRSMSIPHTYDTQVGNEYVRGVSGGERKRVSILEVLAARSAVTAWDNSTRGLDASTALAYAKAIRTMTDVFGVASIVTLYQAGNGIYELFDKVLVLDQGQQLYYGPLKEAKPFMESLGFEMQDGANIADYLTGVCVPTERRIMESHKHNFPSTAVAIREAFEKSAAYEKGLADLDYPNTSECVAITNEFKEAIREDKHKSLPKKSSHTVSFAKQTQICLKRQIQILKGDKGTLVVRQGSTLIQALIVGSLFYNSPNNTSGIFLRGGTLFFSVLFHTLLSLSEVTDSFVGRRILAKHKSFAYFHPMAIVLAQVLADIPVILFQISHFSIVMYFMTGLKVNAAAFFTYWFILVVNTLAMTSFFRVCGAAFDTFDAASKVSGFALSAVIIYSGYLISKPEMHPWLVWIYWIDPMAYAFEALMGNEFHDLILPCVNNNLVPNGATYTNAAYQGCAGVGGAVFGQTYVTGDAYLASISYSHSHLWRNVGVLFCWWLLFVLMAGYFMTFKIKDSASRGYQKFPREQQKLLANTPHNDEESQVEKRGPATAQSEGGDISENAPALLRNTSVFTWRNLKYTVSTPSGPRVLLDDVQGWVKPGMLGALMGSSGAGKTTLLDVLAQRKTEGTIEGSIRVDGRPLTVSFQRSAGYCEQLDVHESLATVREALEFSALLRQSRNVPREEKVAYVDTIIDLLELQDIEHAIIGHPGAGLGVEQRKRLTIGVELVSKPSILLFLDEPTSGLDGQSAFNTVRFLRKLAEAGQAVLVTIHQPSASLFSQFDTLLLLAKGGKTVYFGDIGDNADTLREYFARNGAVCPSAVNPAEFMIDVVSGNAGGSKDWNEVWLASPEYQKTCTEVSRIEEEAAAKPPGSTDDGFEFAMPLKDQCILVTQRMNTSLYRNTEYIMNKFALHIGSALFNGFTFWMIGNSVADLQLRLFTVFNFIFVAPGVIAQLQPLFIERRDIFEAREKKSKMYSWVAFVTGLIISEFPYLVVCAVLYFVCWYFTVGFSHNANHAGAVFFEMLLYEFFYTGLGQFVAAYAPNAVFAALVNPVLLGIMVAFCGVLVPYAQITTFWRYWIYWLNPFNYLMGSILVFTIFDAEVHCATDEFARFDPPSGQTCGDYLASYLEESFANLVNPTATSACHVCSYTRGSDYLKTINLNDYYYGWRDIGITVIFVLSSYVLVYALMKLRTKQTKTAS